MATTRVRAASPKPETELVARIASMRSPRCAMCSMSASESLYRSRTMHSDWSSLK